MNLALLLARAAAAFPDRPAVSLGTAVWQDYRRLAMRADRFAAALRERFRLAPGDRVALAMSNVPQYPEALFGIWRAGLAAVPINAKLHAKEITWIVDHAGARVAIVSADLAPALGALTDAASALEAMVIAGSAEYERLFERDGLGDVARGAADDLAWLFYTSGTTGRPKGAMLSHRNLMRMVVNYFADVDGIAPTDAIVHCAPLSHGSGLYGLPHLAKAANQVLPDSAGFDPAETFALIARWPGTSFFFAPTMVHRLTRAADESDVDTRNLKTIVYGGGPMYVADLLKAIDRFGPKFAQIYGQGEAPMTITALPRHMHAERDHPRYLDRLGSVGLARTDVEVLVVDGDDRPLPTGEVGEVVCRGDVVMRGYWRNEAASAETLRGGWLHTGDMGAFDTEGFLTLKDRSKDLIISGGSNIYPREIEEVLLAHPDVTECSVVGRAHADWGEEPVAFVVLRPGAVADPQALDRLCLDRIARFKRPKDYRFVTGLPKNNYGKVLKTELRRLLADEG